MSGERERVRRRDSGMGGDRRCSCLPADVPVPPECQPDPPSAHPRTQALCLGEQIPTLRSLSISLSPHFYLSSHPSVIKFMENEQIELRGVKRREWPREKNKQAE